MRTVWKPLARKQFQDAFEYLRDRNEAYANRWRDAVREMIEFVAAMPGIGRRTPNPNHAEMRMINVHSYHLFYAVQSDRIVILEVKHVRQNTDPRTIRDAPLPTPLPAAALQG